MREIEFRAWNKVDKRMFNVLSWSHPLYLDELVEVTGQSSDCVHGHCGSDCILMQYTNLKDKNGKEYYFDDIAKWNNKLWVVVWSVTLAGIELQPLANYRERQENTKIKRLYGTSFGIGQAHYSEHLGNIHQNPELLE